MVIDSHKQSIRYPCRYRIGSNNTQHDIRLVQGLGARLPKSATDILLSLLRLVPVPGISSCPSSDLFPSRVYPLVPTPIGARPGYRISR
eukprot:6144467-Pyramimonas_sp.AAC.2